MLYEVITSDTVSDDLRDGDDFVGKPVTQTLASSQDELGHWAPLLTIIVGAMVGHHDPETHGAGQGGQQGRANGMDMDHIRSIASGDDKGGECMDDRFETLAAWCENTNQADAAPFGVWIFDIV